MLHHALPALLATLATSVLFPVALTSSGAQQSDELAALESAVAAAIHAYESADPEAVAAFYAEDATILSLQGIVPPEAILNALQFHFQLLVRQSFTFEDHGTRMVGPRHGISWFLGTTAGEDDQGNVIFSGTVQVSTVWRLDDGNWRVVFAQEAFYPPD
ncbi:MAG: DUF4440 domain-containing protein [Acidobacteria bacterium]|nr:DUF4440 domain-containing protein [Acidobacteriota bacterium]